MAHRPDLMPSRRHEIIGAAQHIDDAKHWRRPRRDFITGAEYYGRYAISPT